MKKAELKELIRNSILEGNYLEDDPKAMDAMDAAMVKDYEEEESNKYALDKEEPMEESLDDIPDDIEWEVEEVQDRIDAYDAELSLTGYSPSTGKTYAGATVGTDIGGGDWEWTKVDIIDIVAEANRIVEAWNAKKQPLQEKMSGGYLEIMEMNPKFDEGLEMVLEVWNEWKSGQMTEDWMVEEAKQDLLEYLATVLK